MNFVKVLGDIITALKPSAVSLTVLTDNQAKEASFEDPQTAAHRIVPHWEVCLLS